MNHIENFRFWCHKILPMVYDESLSYYEVLCKFRAKLNEMVTAINEQNATIEEFTQTVENWEKEVEDKIDEKIEQGLADLEERLSAEFETWFTTFKNESDATVENTVATYTQELETELSEMQSDFNTAMTNFTNTFNAWFAEQDANIEATVEHYADTYFHNIEDRVEVLEQEVDGQNGLSDRVSSISTNVGIINSTLNHLMEPTLLGTFTNIPAQYTSYSVEWDDYDWIIVEAVHWYSSYQTNLYSHDRVNGSSQGTIDLYTHDDFNDTGYAIAKADSTHLYIKSGGNHSAEANYGIRIYGIKVKGE